MSQLQGTLIDAPEAAPCASDHLFRLIVVGRGEKRKVLLSHGTTMIAVVPEKFLAFVAASSQIYEKAKEAQPKLIVPECGAFGFVRFFGPADSPKVLLAEYTVNPDKHKGDDFPGSADILVLDHGEFWMLLSRGRELYEEAERQSPAAIMVPRTDEV